MHFETQLELGGLIPHRAAVVTALGLWTAGFALAGASGWRMHHEAAATRDSWALAAPSDAPTADTGEPEDILFMPTDAIAGHGTPGTGVALVQKP